MNYDLDIVVRHAGMISKLKFVYAEYLGLPSYTQAKMLRYCDNVFGQAT